VPIFIDSPLSVRATEVFKLHPECYDAEMRSFMESNGDPFSFPSLHYVESREESIRLNDLSGSAIIISASGMAEAGRILHHLKNAVENENNTILIVGFQAQHTLGRRLVERRPRVRILGVERDLYAHVEVMNAFSAHGDKNDLRQYANQVSGVRRVFLIHGETEQQEPLGAQLTADGKQVVIPALGDVAELD
jgi:metallo-beta-lactamase family protein